MYIVGKYFKVVLCLCLLIQKKYDHAKKHSEIAVVTPHWVLECVGCGQLLPTDRYHPSLLKSAQSPSRACNGAADPEPPCLSMPISISNLILGPNVLRTSSIVAETPSEEAAELKGKFGGDGVRPGRLGQPVEQLVNQSGAAKSQTEKTEQEVAEGVGVACVDADSVSERLLEGIVICFIDYQECVEDDTLEKWKLVR